MNLHTLRANRPSGLLYHYTTQTGLLGIISKRSIWATGIQYLNDTSEYRYAITVIREVLADRTFAFQSIASDPIATLLDGGWVRQSDGIFVTSFSERDDQLGQWRAYSRGGNGFSLGFDPAGFEQGLGRTYFALVQCIYELSAQREVIETLLTPHLVSGTRQPEADRTRAMEALNIFAAEVRFIAPMLKDPAFSEEREWRLVSAPLGPHYESFALRDCVRS